jgi:hypothetical protein
MRIGKWNWDLIGKWNWDLIGKTCKNKGFAPSEQGPNWDLIFPQSLFPEPLDPISTVHVPSFLLSFFPNPHSERLQLRFVFAVVRKRRRRFRRGRGPQTAPHRRWLLRRAGGTPRTCEWSTPTYLLTGLLSLLVLGGAAEGGVGKVTQRARWEGSSLANSHLLGTCGSDSNGSVWRPRFLISVIKANDRISWVKPVNVGQT